MNIEEFILDNAQLHDTIIKLDAIIKDSKERILGIEQELEKYNSSINIISSPNKEFLNIIVDSKEIKANNKQGVVKLVTILMKRKKIKAISTQKRDLFR